MIWLIVAQFSRGIFNEVQWKLNKSNYVIFPRLVFQSWDKGICSSASLYNVFVTGCTALRTVENKITTTSTPPQSISMTAVIISLGWTAGLEMFPWSCQILSVDERTLVSTHPVQTWSYQLNPIQDTAGLRLVIDWSHQHLHEFSNHFTNK